jgi:RND family efflux transporter MFP subunit
MSPQHSSVLFRGFPVLIAVMAAVPAAAQTPAQRPSPVRFTEAREHVIRQSVQLTGSVQAAMLSLVASEIAGAVLEFPGREGTAVKRGQPLARLRQTSLELRIRAAEAELQEAEARHQLAERELERAQNLFKEEIFSQQQLDTARYELDARRGRIDQLRADIDRLKDDLDRSTIRAPFEGVVVAEHTAVGEWVAVGGPIAELQATTPLDVLVDVPERYYSVLRRGTEAAITFDALDGVELRGRITAIVPRANEQARTFPVKIRIPNPGGRIGAGMVAQVAFPLGEPYRATIVPKDAVMVEGTERFVFVINGSDTVERVPVQSGPSSGDWVAVEGTVAAGTRVVTRGNERLRPGQSVTGQPLEYALP